jgi:hypothetical protein
MANDRRFWELQQVILPFGFESPEKVLKQYNL